MTPPPPGGANQGSGRVYGRRRGGAIVGPVPRSSSGGAGGGLGGGRGVRSLGQGPASVSTRSGGLCSGGGGGCALCRDPDRPAALPRRRATSTRRTPPRAAAIRSNVSELIPRSPERNRERTLGETLAVAAMVAGLISLSRMS